MILMEMTFGHNGYQPEVILVYQLAWHGGWLVPDDIYGCAGNGRQEQISRLYPDGASDSGSTAC
jgi:hypothetical protein